jgi:hypothetical protein
MTGWTDELPLLRDLSCVGIVCTAVADKIGRKTKNVASESP